MKKEEKIIIICFLITFFSIVASYIYTCYKIKPNDAVFNIEKILS